jgi:molybdopterin/thiamine biosynthesis adenylyltransferase
MTLIDRDTVGESNINRQLCASVKTLGRAKTAVMAERLLDVNPEIELRCIEGDLEWGPAGRRKRLSDVQRTFVYRGPLERSPTW